MKLKAVYKPSIPFYLALRLLNDVSHVDLLTYRNLCGIDTIHSINPQYLELEVQNYKNNKNTLKSSYLDKLILIS